MIKRKRENGEEREEMRKEGQIKCGKVKEKENKDERKKGRELSESREEKSSVTGGVKEKAEKKYT